MRNTGEGDPEKPEAHRLRTGREDSCFSVGGGLSLVADHMVVAWALRGIVYGRLGEERVEMAMTRPVNCVGGG